MVEHRNIPEKISEEYLAETACNEISRYLERGGSYPGLVSQLGAYFKSIDAGRENRLNELWIKLETLNALALAESNTSPKPEDVGEVRHILNLALDCLKAVDFGQGRGR